MRQVLYASCIFAGLLVCAGPASAQQSLMLQSPPSAGVVVPLADHSGFIYTSPVGVDVDFTVLTQDDYGGSFIDVTVNAQAGTAAIKNDEFGGPIATAAVLARSTADGVQTTMTLLISVWQPNVALAVDPPND